DSSAAAPAKSKRAAESPKTSRQQEVLQIPPTQPPAPPGPPAHAIPPGPPIGDGFPSPGGLPGDPELPDVTVPQNPSQVPELGLLGPEGAAVSAAANPPGQARALQTHVERQACELIAVALLAIMMGEMAGMLAPRTGRR